MSKTAISIIKNSKPCTKEIIMNSPRLTDKNSFFAKIMKINFPGTKKL